MLKVFSIEKLLSGLIPLGEKKIEGEYVLCVGGEIYSEENLVLQKEHNDNCLLRSQ